MRCLLPLIAIFVLTPGAGALPVAAGPKLPLAVTIDSQTDASAACVRVQWGQYGGSGTCLATESGKSLVLTCNHVFSDGGIGAYPQDCTVQHKGKVYTATAVAGDREADLALVVVDGELPCADIESDNAAIGTEVWHRGIGSGGGSGRVASVPGIGRYQWVESSCHFAADMPSVSGDSGAGVFTVTGRLVAVHNGRFGAAGDLARGTPLTPVRNFLRATARFTFPGFAARLDLNRAMAAAASAAAAKSAPPAAKPVETPAPKAKAPEPAPVFAPSACPGGVCPTGTTTYYYERPRFRIFR